MIVGLYDRDLALVDGKTPTAPKFQLMKVYAYCKKNKIMVNLMPSLKDYALYTKIYYFQDEGDLAPELSKMSEEREVICKGRTFSNMYEMLEPKIESCAPDASVYLKLWEKRGIGKKYFPLLTRHAHIMMTLDGKTPYPYNDWAKGWRRSRQIVAIHDYYLPEDWYSQFCDHFPNEGKLEIKANIVYPQPILWEEQLMEFCSGRLYGGSLCARHTYFGVVNKELIDKIITLRQTKSWADSILFVPPAPAREELPELFEAYLKLGIEARARGCSILINPVNIKEPEGYCCLFQLVTKWLASKKTHSSFEDYVYDSRQRTEDYNMWTCIRTYMNYTEAHPEILSLARIIPNKEEA